MLNSWQLLVVLSGEHSHAVLPSVGTRRTAGGGLSLTPCEQLHRGGDHGGAWFSLLCHWKRVVISPFTCSRSPDGRQAGPQLWLTWPPVSPKGGVGSSGDPIPWAQPCWKSQSHECACGKPGLVFCDSRILDLVYQNWPIWRVCCQIIKIKKKCMDMWIGGNTARNITYLFMEIWDGVGIQRWDNFKDSPAP